MSSWNNGPTVEAMNAEKPRSQIKITKIDYFEDKWSVRKVFVWELSKPVIF